MRCAGQWLHLGLTVDSLSGLALTIDEVTAEDAATLKAWIEPIAQSVGAQVLVSDDADGFKRSLMNWGCCIRCAKATSSAIPRPSLRS